MCTVLLPPGDNPIAVNKYSISYQYSFSPKDLLKMTIPYHFLSHLNNGPCMKNQPAPFQKRIWTFMFQYGS